MGLPMAQRLRDRGFAVAVHDVDPARQALAAADRLVVAASPAAIAEACEVVSIVVVDAAQIDAVFDGSDGLLAALRPHHAVLLHSTISPGDAERLAAAVLARGARVLDAPISGGPQRARDGSMSVMLAGDPATRDSLAPILEALAARRFAISGRPGDAARAKLVNNLAAGIALAASAEAVALAMRVGLDARAIHALMQASSGQSWIGGDRIPRALDGDLVPRAQSHVLAKDLRLAAAMARDAGVDLVLGPAAQAVFDGTVEAGWRHDDDAAVLLWFARRFGAGHIPG